MVEQEEEWLHVHYEGASRHCENYATIGLKLACFTMTLVKPMTRFYETLENKLLSAVDNVDIVNCLISQDFIQNTYEENDQLVATRLVLNNLVEFSLEVARRNVFWRLVAANSKLSTIGLLKGLLKKEFKYNEIRLNRSFYFDDKQYRDFVSHCSLLRSYYSVLIGRINMDYEYMDGLCQNIEVYLLDWNNSSLVMSREDWMNGSSSLDTLIRWIREKSAEIYEECWNIADCVTFNNNNLVEVNILRQAVPIRPKMTFEIVVYYSDFVIKCFHFFYYCIRIDRDNNSKLIKQVVQETMDEWKEYYENKFY